MIRIFKEEAKLEVWKQKSSGRYDLAASYDICKWSGKLGPKFTEGDRQAPEGFYFVRAHQMNPNSSYHLAFNIGFPNI
jgi:murein L,D-transpeptidase YafK